MNPLNTIKGTLIAGVVLAVVLTFVIKYVAAPKTDGGAEAPTAAETAAPEAGDAMVIESTPPMEEIMEEDAVPMEEIPEEEVVPPAE
ncbi:MAG: hypothetical protein ACRETN_10670 [Nevskiales bacterium]